MRVKLLLIFLAFSSACTFALLQVQRISPPFGTGQLFPPISAEHARLIGTRPADPLHGDGVFSLKDAKHLRFSYTCYKTKISRETESTCIFDLPYSQIDQILYSTKPVKPSQAKPAPHPDKFHYLTLICTYSNGDHQILVYEISQDLVQTMLPLLEKRTGKKIEKNDTPKT